MCPNHHCKACHKGECNGNHVLRDEDVKFIRNLKSIYTYAKLSEIFGVGMSAIIRANLRKTWRHIK